MRIASGNISMIGTIGVSVVAFLLIMKLLRYRKHILIKDKVVLITGASSGLGEACAHIFYKKGAKIILCARRLGELQRVKSDLLNLSVTGVTHEPSIIQLDLSQLSGIPQIVQEALAIHEKVDILINNGGISSRSAVLDTNLDVDTQLMMVNFFGQVALTKCLLPSMVSHGYGHIVAVSSIQGRIAIPFRSSYSASKHAIQAFCDSLRAEVSHQNIHVSVVSPGYIRTNLSSNALIGDGSKHGEMDSTTESGMSPFYVADQILTAVERQQPELVLAPFLHRAMVVIRSLWPSLYFTLMNFRAQKQYKSLQKSK